MIALNLNIEGDSCIVSNIDGTTDHKLDEGTTVYSLLVAHRRKAKKQKENAWKNFFKPTLSGISMN